MRLPRLQKSRPELFLPLLRSSSKLLKKFGTLLTLNSRPQLLLKSRPKKLYSRLRLTSMLQLLLMLPPKMPIILPGTIFKTQRPSSMMPTTPSLTPRPKLLMPRMLFSLPLRTMMTPRPT